MKIQKKDLQSSKSRQNQAGLTLVELLVVLVVLASVAGILVQLFPDVQQRAHGATGGDNMKEIAKALELERVTTGSYPDDWDSLIDSNDVLAATADLVLTDLTAPAADSLEETIANALADANITSSFQQDDFTDATINQTFEGLSDPAVDSLATDADVATLTPAGIDNLGLQPTGDGVAAYVAFGLGAESTAIGSSMVDAPVHYLEGGESPIENYARWVVVFAVPDEGPLRLASVAGIEDGEELSGLNGHLNEYYEALQ